MKEVTAELEEKSEERARQLRRETPEAFRLWFIEKVKSELRSLEELEDSEAGEETSTKTTLAQG